ncbi:AMP-binding protein [Halorhodospira halophila]|uniref:AMP-dependent synthetase and ligase n=1 Tax=Halorhodospira halophila (strain DSM 244 / SL1) TaxID=349124 RepID=A1WTB7_HALHL|nr:AMP-binding protein [Halorhodospira halophila]ABM60929.1 AMP-dependent synthetase and ligase [Halorhodospira halophila SL1]MBK1728587.1 long-chain fatty acid--CoA ligase [Halorhodospira halophila]
MAAVLSYDDLPMEWVGNWSGRRAALTPERLALYEPDSERCLTYRQADRRAERAAAMLTETLGIGPREPICLLSRNRLEAVDLYLACGKTGVVLAPLSYRLAQSELSDLVRRIAPRALFYDEAFADLAGKLDLPAGAQRIELADGRGPYFEAVEAGEGPASIQNRPLALADPYLYVHTGGTTATPKICVVSHRQMVWNAIDILVTSGGSLGPQQELLTFPLFHIGGWNTLTPVFYAGGYTVMPRSFDPGQALELIEGEGITHFGAVEAMLQLMAEHPRFAGVDMSTLEQITTAGAPCSSWTMQPFWQRGVRVSQSYGMTEAGPSNFLYIGDDQGIDELREHHDSVGTSMFHTDYRIVDPEGLERVPAGEVGVLLMRSPHNFDGYLDEPERSADTLLADGWVYSGDLAYQDDEGYVRLVGRVDNMFISGGENIAPEEVERVLLRHAGVRKAAVVGVPDPRWGAVPAAALVARDGAEVDAAQIRQFAERELARYKVPRLMRFFEELPLTGAGKVDRNRVREQLTRENAAASGEEQA